jgi:hypothetical protein
VAFGELASSSYNSSMIKKQVLGGCLLFLKTIISLMKIINSSRFFKNPDLEFHFHFEKFPKTGPGGWICDSKYSAKKKNPIIF